MALAMFTIELIHYEYIWHQPIRSLHYLINAASMLFTWIKFNCSFAGIRICTFFFLYFSYPLTICEIESSLLAAGRCLCMSEHVFRATKTLTSYLLYALITLSLSLYLIPSVPTSCYCYLFWLSCNFNSISLIQLLLPTLSQLQL